MAATMTLGSVRMAKLWEALGDVTGEAADKRRFALALTVWPTLAAVQDELVGWLARADHSGEDALAQDFWTEANRLMYPR